ncbi:hypothetical protein CEW92_04940 [Bacillaceae bacterium SAS-127]|nr:hypothetical protein CEW92_04940 [Bacillaceae bacterium SAS-127]
MKYSQLNEVEWDKYSVLGFDMDGTLYDEFQFIEQVYYKIAKYLALFSVNEENYIYNWLLERWKKKGSSYPYIFSEALVEFGINDHEQLKNCLSIFRSFQPQINLNNKIINFLDSISLEKELFLITDGHEFLQRAKFDSLQLTKWFKAKNVVFTGSFGSEYYKPNISTLKHIDCLQQFQSPVLYIGDRFIDEQFAENANFDFLHVKKFIDFWGVDL